MLAKRWSTVYPTASSPRKSHRSQAAAYRFVRAEAQAWADGLRRSPLLVVYVDDRDGRGWRTFERVDLREVSG